MPTPRQLHLLTSAARKFKIDPSILYGVWGAETNFAGARNAPRSPAGASGPFQFMPGTAPGYGVNPYDNQFKDDVYGAAKYLSTYKSRGRAGMLAAYNAGPGGSPSNPETQAYIPKVLSLAKQYPGAPAGIGSPRVSSGGPSGIARPTAAPDTSQAQMFAALSRLFSRACASLASGCANSAT